MLVPGFSYMWRRTKLFYDTLCRTDEKRLLMPCPKRQVNWSTLNCLQLICLYLDDDKKLWFYYGPVSFRDKQATTTLRQRAIQVKNDLWRPTDPSQAYHKMHGRGGGPYRGIVDTGGLGNKTMLAAGRRRLWGPYISYIGSKVNQKWRWNYSRESYKVKTSSSLDFKWGKDAHLNAMKMF